MDGATLQVCWGKTSDIYYSRNMRPLYWVCESDIKVFDFFDYLVIEYLLNNKKTKEKSFQISYKVELQNYLSFLLFLSKVFQKFNIKVVFCVKVGGEQTISCVSIKSVFLFNYWIWSGITSFSITFV